MVIYLYHDRHRKLAFAVPNLKRLKHFAGIFNGLLQRLAQHLALNPASRASQDEIV